LMSDGRTESRTGPRAPCACALGTLRDARPFSAIGSAVCGDWPRRRSMEYETMDKDRAASNVKKATGKIKEAAGKAAGDRRTEAKGKAEKTEGKVQGAVGKVKDSMRK
jgi:uncharacterized protein YjbJ (UPF0337 family)